VFNEVALFPSLAIVAMRLCLSLFWLKNIFLIYGFTTISFGFLDKTRFGSSRSNLNKIFTSSTYLGKNPVFIAGGGSGVGLEVIKLLVQLGTPVHALVRKVEVKEVLEKYPGVKVTLGDALDESAVQSCMQGCVAAVTTLGGKGSDGTRSSDYFGNANVVEQAGILGVERIILVTR